MAKLRCDIELKIADKHWEPFHEMLMDRHMRGKDALNWLREQGYKISSTSFYRYRQKILVGRGMEFSDEELAAQRKRVADYAVRFDPKMLAMLALFGDFLASRGEFLGKVSRGVQTAFDG